MKSRNQSICTFVILIDLHDCSVFILLLGDLFVLYCIINQIKSIMIECYLRYNVFVKLWITLVAAVGICALGLLVAWLYYRRFNYLISHVVENLLDSTELRSLRWRAVSLRRWILVLASIVFATVIQAAMGAFRCYDDENKVSRLYADSTIECGSSVHKFMQALAIVVIIVIGFGMPASFTLIVYYLKRHKLLEHPDYLDSLGSLYGMPLLCLLHRVTFYHIHMHMYVLLCYACSTGQNGTIRIQCILNPLF